MHLRNKDTHDKFELVYGYNEQTIYKLRFGLNILITVPHNICKERELLSRKETLTHYIMKNTC